ncbi:RNA polymerase sigma factor [Allobranchiibius sp. CTAmp26]|uniref:RNA polymerase sigma factor n=1 Tax=Allobranchiibius sp. CTAmp26 TaxID=2815214 RepID=UPI001AA11452|nr:sigma-70 family RNA polymerase sigma factor [Allobranchiibius sp. CTAmp26]MBO1756840.1 sigma-70 family RNA polymerase sigma factor [Allobranchiibius sp. CTAmp26]
MRDRPEPAGVSSAADAVEQAYRQEWAQVVATTIRVARDIQIAEDCVQEAFTAALLKWPHEGVPDRPGAWLTTVAVRNALQVHRRNATLTRKLPQLLPDDPGALPVDPSSGTVFEQLPDDRLRLIFTCCHPALAPEARVALTLRLVCGLTSVEVAKAFLVTQSTMQARITRAKKKIADAGIAYRTPDPAEFPERLTSVLDTVHLVFNEGYRPASGDLLIRADLTARALQTARMLHELLPHSAETTALLALLLLIEARRDARVDSHGEAVDLEHQDRSRWDRALIDEGLTLLAAAVRGDDAGKYTVMASLAAVHDTSAGWAQTDWAHMLALYDVLQQHWPTPVVALARAVAVSFARGPDEGLAALEPLVHDPALTTYPYLPAARADMLRRLGRVDDAAAGYREAILLTANAAEARFFQGRIDDLTARD